MSNSLFKFVLILFLSLTIFSSCTFVSHSYKLEKPSEPHIYEKIWGVDIFKVKAKCGPENNQAHTDLVVELMSMSDVYFVNFEQTDDYAHILGVIDRVGYRPATQCELLALAADYPVPFVVLGKIVAFGSFSLNGEVFI